MAIEPVRTRVPEETVKAFAAATSRLPLLALKREGHRATLAAVLLDVLGQGAISSLCSVLKNRRQGACIVELPGADTELAIKLAIATGRSLGPLRLHLVTGSCYDEAVLTHSEGLTAPPHKPSAYRPERLHTDGHASEERRDDFVILLVARMAHAAGGRSLLLHLDEWGDREDFLRSLWSRAPVHFVRLRLGAVSRQTALGTEDEQELDRAVAPIFFETGSGLAVRYAEEYMHVEREDQGEYVRALGRSLDGDPGVWRGRLEAGHMLILNNTFWFHGRERFEENPALLRHLVRVRGRFEQ